MSEAVTSSEMPGVAELVSLGWSSTTVPISKRASNGSHQAKYTLFFMLTFRNAYFQAAITKIYQWTMHNL